MISYRYRNIDVSLVGPFGLNAMLNLKDGLCLIEGGNGLGKTTLANALLGDFPNIPRKIKGKEEPLERWLVSYSEGIEIKIGHIGGPWTILERAISHGVFCSRDIDRFCKLVSDGINQMLAIKLRTPLSKFGGLESEEFIFDVDTNNQLTANVSLGGEVVSYLFQAMGEKLVLHLASIGAIRELVRPKLDAPFVIDGCFGYLDMHLAAGIFDFVHTLSPQVILIENMRFFKSMELKPDFVIRMADDRQSEIIALTD